MLKLRQAVREPRLHRSELAARLSAIRTELFGEYGLPELARQIGVPVQTWSSYEAGATLPAEILLIFLEKTGTNPDWLRSGEGSRYLDPARQPMEFEFDDGETGEAGVDAVYARTNEVVLSLSSDPSFGHGRGVESPSLQSEWECERWALIQETRRLERRSLEAVPLTDSETQAPAKSVNEESVIVRPFRGTPRYTRAANHVSTRSEVQALRADLDEARSDARFRQDVNLRLHESLEQLRLTEAAEVEAARAAIAAAYAQFRLAVDDVCLLQTELDRLRKVKKPTMATKETMSAFRNQLQEIHARQLAERDKNRQAGAGSWISRQLSRLGWIALPGGHRQSHARIRAAR